MSLFELRAEIERSSDSGFRARIVPFGESVQWRGKPVSYEPGGVRIPDSVPVKIDHGGGVMSRIGMLRSSVESDVALFGDFEFADTSAARDVRALMSIGALTDVSAAIEFDKPFDGGVMTGILDHVAVVETGRFGSSENPSKVLSVHTEEKEPTVAEVVEAAAPVVAEYDDTEIKGSLVEFKEEVVRLADEVSVLSAGVPMQSKFSGDEIFAGMLMQNAGVTIEHQLADVIGDLGAADASGLVPDFYWAAGLQHRVDRRRPLFATAGAAPFPASGNNLMLPKVSQETLVGPRTAQKAIANSRALQVIEVTYPIQWFDGAVDVALEIISQSDPSVLGVINSSMLTQYATATELDATTIVEAAATVTGAPLDITTYASLVADLITTSDLIEDATGSPGDLTGVTSAQWISILSLMDGGDRRQFSIINPQNADGTGSLTTRGIDIGGIFVYRAPAATVAVQYNSDSFKNGEKSPMQVAALNVELMGRDVGILGATVNVTWPEGVYKYSV